MRTVSLVAIMLTAWTGGVWARGHVVDIRGSWPQSEERVVLVPPESAPVLAFGYREAAADVLWVRALNYYGTGVRESTGFRYLRPIIDTIISLAPRFEPIYRWASTTVMVQPGKITQDEVNTSVHYLKLGVKEFPENYHLLFQLGIAYYNDMEGTPEEIREYRLRGAKLIERAIHAEGAHPSLAITAAAMQTRLGQAERAEKIIREAILTTDDDRARSEMTEYFGALVDPAGAEALRDAHEAFIDRWKGSMPHVDATTFILLGEPPPEAFDMSRLATPRDIFGANDLDDIEEDRLGLDDLVPVDELEGKTEPDSRPPPSPATP